MRTVHLVVTFGEHGSLNCWEDKEWSKPIPNIGHEVQLRRGDGSIHSHLVERVSWDMEADPVCVLLDCQVRSI